MADLGGCRPGKGRWGFQRNRRTFGRVFRRVTLESVCRKSRFSAFLRQHLRSVTRRAHWNSSAARVLFPFFSAVHDSPTDGIFKVPGWKISRSGARTSAATTIATDFQGSSFPCWNINEIIISLTLYIQEWVYIIVMNITMNYLLYFL